MIKAIKKYFAQKKYFVVIKTFVETYILHPENYSILEGAGLMTSCVYRHPQGKKCAIGMYIPDELYNSDWEGKNINSIYPSIKNVLPIDDKLFWNTLQQNHDECADSKKASNEDRKRCILIVADVYCPSFKNKIEKLLK
jgi:hypothetical protein